MTRFLAGAGACFLCLTGAFLLWQGRAQDKPMLPEAPARSDRPSMVVGGVPVAPQATAKSREQKRFSRADKDKNGRIEREELLASRRKAFSKLDKNGNGALSFDERAVKTIDKFAGADKDKSGWLNAGEYAPPRLLRRRKSAVRVNSVFNPTLPLVMI